MYQFKKGTAAILAGVLSVSSVVPAFAAVPGDTENYDHVTTAGGVGNAAVTLTVEDREEPVIFSAYVPSELPIAIDVNGEVVVPEDAKIINGVENLPIAVEAINVTMEDGWTLASMSDDLTAEAKDTKKVAMEVLGQDLSDAASFSPAKIEANGDIALNMKANLPDQSASSQTKIATIGFTVNWWEEQDSTPVLHATNELSKAYMDPVLKSLTGNITFSTEGYDPEQHTGTATDISAAQDGSVMAVVNGQDAVVYSEGGVYTTYTGTENSPETGFFAEYSVNYLDLSGFDTQHMTNTVSMFDRCYNLRSINGLNTFQTTNTETMHAMFACCHFSGTLDLTAFDTSNVSNMFGAFSHLSADVLDLSSFDMSNVKNVDYLFYDSNIKTVYCRSESDAAIMKASSYCPSSINFVVKS